jgi:nicotinamide mononucleotide transporter
MEIYYILAGIYGLIVWKKTKAKSKHKRVSSSGISRTPLAVWVAIAGVYTVLHAAIYIILVNFTDSTVPFWDALTTALSVVAYWLLSRKFIEQWFVWLAVDIVCVGLYIHKDIPLTASLYALYSVLAIVGYLKWKRIMRAESEGDSTFNC